MPIFLLGENPEFPPAQLASREGIIATGGDLSVKRLINAYSSGIFPWFSDGEPILWWSPDPRLVVLPGDLHISHSMQKELTNKTFTATFDRHFKTVLDACSDPRNGREGTWLTKEMKRAYNRLHKLGYAHSLEVWESGKTSNPKQVVGGLYGVSVGKCFCGESMFSKVTNASKYAFIVLCKTLFQQGFLMIDCQVPTTHLKSLGAREISRIEYLKLLQRCLAHQTILEKWPDTVPS